MRPVLDIQRKKKNEKKNLCPVARHYSNTKSLTRVMPSYYTISNW